jgi:tRNA uridine 5-carboxymethylaminomethyl modification enzyme
MKVDPVRVNDELAKLNTSPIREKVSISHLLKRPEISINELMKLSDTATMLNKYSLEVLEQAEIVIKYESYIAREQKLAQKIGGLEDYKIKPDFEYDRVNALSSEGREKLKRIKPETIGQASRISGVSPSDISILTVYLGK